MSGSVRKWGARALSVSAFVVLWIVLAAPNDIDALGWTAALRIPIELLALIALATILPPRARRIVAISFGGLVGIVALLKILDMGFLVAFGRESNPASDWSYVGGALDLLSLSIGRSPAVASLVVAAVLTLGLLVAVPWAAVRVTSVAARHRSSSRRAVYALTLVWLVVFATGPWLFHSVPVASASTTRLLADHSVQAVESIRDDADFMSAAAVDPLALLPDNQLFNALHGKDVLVVFVESYGRVAVEDPAIAATVTPVLDNGSRALAAKGFSARSAFLTSPTFGGISWLAHSTLQTGLWVDSQRRYDQLLAGHRTTLSSAFKRAGWRTVSDIPSDEEDWTAGREFYDYDAVYDARNVGYRGPHFGYASMPDQYVLDAFRQRELTNASRPPVMAEIDLVSSHTPWTPLPSMVPWEEVADGSVFAPMAVGGSPKDVLWRNSDAVRSAYARSVAYTWTAITSFVTDFGDPNLVLVILGDHQPARIVSGADAGHDVPVTIVAHDPDVLRRIGSWGWDDGLRPAADAPVTPMDQFRDRFVEAFSAK